MIIDKDSPLRRLPSNLNMKQTLFLDAIRYSVEMADIAYNRLTQTLLSLTVEHEQGKGLKNLGTTTVLALLDAWSIVNSTYRLRNLFKQMPYVKQKASKLAIFYRQTKSAEELRHGIQHLNHEIDKLVADALPAWGVLNWVAVLEPDNENILTCSLIPGTVFQRSTPMFNPVGREIRPPIDFITLETEHSLCLSDVMQHVSEVVSSLQRELEEQTKGLPNAASDLFLCLVLENKPEDKSRKDK